MKVENVKILTSIQSELKAPKNQYNKFGKYKYRSGEDILEAAKPVLASYGCAIALSDDVVLVGDRYYVESRVVLYFPDGEHHAVLAKARESENKKGMDSSQVTGATSSYARKYALNGMFALDDTKDADSMPKPETKPTLDDSKIKLFCSQLKEGTNKITVEALKEKYALTPNQIKAVSDVKS